MQGSHICSPENCEWCWNEESKQVWGCNLASMIIAVPASLGFLCLFLDCTKLFDADVPNHDRCNYTGAPTAHLYGFCNIYYDPPIEPRQY